MLQMLTSQWQMNSEINACSEFFPHLADVVNSSGGPIFSARVSVLQCSVQATPSHTVATLFDTVCPETCTARSDVADDFFPRSTCVVL